MDKPRDLEPLKEYAVALTAIQRIRKNRGLPDLMKCWQ